MTKHFLKKGDIVDIISPGTACDMREIKQIKNLIHSLDLQPSIFLEEQTTLKRSASHEFPSFSPAIRFEQFKQAVENPDSKIIWCSRGGYGSAEILPFLNKLKKPKRQKIFIGFSDISSLNQLLIGKWGWKVICAPMLAQMTAKMVSDKSIKQIQDLIFGKKTDLSYPLKELIPTAKPIKAPIVGGCISVLAGQFGTKNQLNWHKKILFLEDEGEDGERLDRYFQQILSIIHDQKIFPKAILLGNFMEANPHGTPKAKNITFAIDKFSKALLKEFPKIALFEEKNKVLGHSKNMLPLVLGSNGEITQGRLIQKL